MGVHNNEASPLCRWRRAAFVFLVLVVPLMSTEACCMKTKMYLTARDKHRRPSVKTQTDACNGDKPQTLNPKP
jgi:hypothetical protein